MKRNSLVWRMGALLFAGIVSCAAPTANTKEEAWTLGATKSQHLGQPFTLQETTPLLALGREPARYMEKIVRTRGRVDSVCNHAGCWIDLLPLEGTGAAVFVNPQKKAFTFPLDSSGRLAEVEGRFFVAPVEQTRAQHWSKHGWRPGLRIDGPIEVLRLEATAAQIFVQE
jgi:hypothetical protein